MPEHRHTKKRLVVLANHRRARFVLSKGVKIHETVLCLSNRAEEHILPLSHHRRGHDKGLADSHFFPPHTQFKEIEKEAFAHEISTKEVNRWRKQSRKKKMLSSPNIYK